MEHNPPFRPGRDAVTLRLRFWLFAMDALSWLGLSERLYLYALSKASDATDWGGPLPAETGEEPF